jgi:hypothetical protein
MRRKSFHEWLKTRPQEVPDVGQLALLIAQAGAAGISPNDIRRLIPFPPETLDELLKSLVTTRQVMVVKLNGELRYRATG